MFCTKKNCQVSLFSTILKELYINFVSEIENHLPSTILEIIERSGKFTRENIYILLHKVHQSQPFKFILRVAFSQSPGFFIFFLANSLPLNTITGFIYFSTAAPFMLLF